MIKYVFQENGGEQQAPSTQETELKETPNKSTETLVRNHHTK